jgi:hypothetical protein
MKLGNSITILNINQQLRSFEAIVRVPISTGDIQQPETTKYLDNQASKIGNYLVSEGFIFNIDSSENPVQLKAKLLIVRQ